jgi:hypothetical protein
VVDHCYFERSDANEIELGARSRTGKFENELVVAGDLACELLDSFSVLVYSSANREPMSIRISGCALFSGTGFRTSAPGRISPVRRDLPFSCQVRPVRFRLSAQRCRPRIDPSSPGPASIDLSDSLQSGGQSYRAELPALLSAGRYPQARA